MHDYNYKEIDDLLAAGGVELAKHNSEETNSALVVAARNTKNAV